MQCGSWSVSVTLKGFEQFVLIVHSVKWLGHNIKNSALCKKYKFTSRLYVDELILGTVVNYDSAESAEKKLRCIKDTEYCQWVTKRPVIYLIRWQVFFWLQDRIN